MGDTKRISRKGMHKKEVSEIKKQHFLKNIISLGSCDPYDKETDQSDQLCNKRTS